MIILIIPFILFIIFILLFSIKKEKNSFIYLNISKENIPLQIMNNNDKLFHYICENVDIEDFKCQFYDIVSQYKLIIINKVIYDRAFENPNGEIFKYIFNLESCPMLLKEGIFCEIHFLNKKIPINVLFSK